MFHVILPQVVWQKWKPQIDGMYLNAYQRSGNISILFLCTLDVAFVLTGYNICPDGILYLSEVYIEFSFNLY